MTKVFIKIVAIGEEVVYISMEKFTFQTGENTVDQALKGGRGVHQPERHDAPNINLAVEAKGCFLAVRWVNWYLPKSGCQIYFGENFGGACTKTGLLEGHTIAILFSNFIEVSVI